MKSIYKFILLSICSSALMFAQNYNDGIRVSMPGLGSNARSLGMGNSYIAMSDDASAAFFNPAGFGLIKKMELSGGISLSSFNNDASIYGTTTSDNSNKTNFDRISFAIPFPTVRGSLVFGLSYNKSKDFNGLTKFDGFNTGNHSMIQYLNDELLSDIPYDLYLTDENYNSPINGNLNQSGRIETSGSIDNWTLSGAMEIYKNLFFGVNLNIVSGNFLSDNDFYEDDTRNVYQGQIDPQEPLTQDFMSFYFNRIIDWDISGYDAKVGFLYQVQNVARIGATIQFPKSYTINERFTVNAQSDFASTGFDLISEDYSDKVKYDIVTPFEIAGGASVNFHGLILSTQATLIDYSQMELKAGEGIGDDLIATSNKDIKDLLTLVANFNFGVEYNIPQSGLRLRGGFMVQPSPFKNDKSDFDKKYLTGGIGYIADGLVGIDLGYAYGWWKDISDNYGSELSRIEHDIKVHNLVLTTTFRF